ncbi:MAG TPA: phage tail protein [Flavobacteriaceae bacterium]|jgi:microcystin-dependent protein|nr:phage tail protein [Flavobacteriaceae bacterium]MAM29966.1 phage tail protein [Flavobacteriaceae bacterium]HBR55604.1 phage tail protein [Flavobacteriaceae bacterium]HIB46719.1 phage tail protein [Flavobacteriaceae bacterium]HIN98583.1 phage tail protein [Flavobacteriaceae bacterium]|tara:strand:- start:666 stop:1181 length:516 start_codon:yes stop_codon:yes gene_type:complete
MEPFLGQIQAFGFNFAPRGWSKCEGQLLPISQWTALFSLLGTTFGGDGRTTFGLPDLRSRSIVGMGQGPGLDNITWGEKGGNYTHTLTTQQMPSHAHSVQVAVNSGAGDEANPTSFIASHAGGFSEESTANAHLGGVTSQNVGGNQPYNTRNPFLGINVCIAMVGIFPSRN